MHPPLRVRVLLCALGLTLLAGCGGVAAADDPLTALAARVPASVSDDGILLRRGVAGNELLADLLGVPPGAVAASATTPAPALRMLLVDGSSDRVAETLTGSGYERSTDDGWTLLTPGPGSVGLLGVPAVAIGPDVVAVGGVEQLRVLAQGGTPLSSADVLGDADEALLVPARAIDERSTATGFAGGLPTFLSAVLTDRDGVGRLALTLPQDGSQDDAVALAVRVRTEGPTTADGTPAFTPETALTAEDAVVVDVSWRDDAPRLLREGLDSSLLAFLGD